MKTRKKLKLKKEVEINIIKSIIILLLTMVLVNSLKNNDIQNLNVYRYNISIMLSYFIITSMILLIPKKKEMEK